MKRALRRVAFLLLAAATVIVTVVVLRTLRMQSRQVTVQPIPVLRVDAQGCLDRLQKAVSFPTISHRNRAHLDSRVFREFRAFLEEAFPVVHSHSDIQVLDGTDFGDGENLSLLYRWRGQEPDDPAVLFLAHMDVVPVESDTITKWSSPPFDGTIDEQFVWGRGTLDVKNALMAFLETLDRLVEDGFQPARTIYFSFGHDEEVGGSDGNRRIAEWMRQEGVRLDWILDEGGSIFSGVPGVESPVALVGIAEKGYLTIRLAVEAEGGHSSIPPRQTAVGILAAAVHRLEDQPFPRRMDGGVHLMLDYLGPEMNWMNRVAVANRWLLSPLIENQLGAQPSGDATLRTTIAVTQIDGGVKENVLPKQAEALVNLRILPGDSVASVVDRVTRVIDDERVQLDVLPGYKEPSAMTSPQSHHFRRLQRTIGEVFPDVDVAPFVVLGGTDSAHYAEFYCDVLRFVPMRLGQEDLTRIHGIDERIGREAYLDMIRFYYRLLSQLNDERL